MTQEHDEAFEEELQRALRSLIEAEGDVERVLRDHPDAERLRPYLELSNELRGLQDRELPPNDEARQVFLEQVREAQARLRAEHEEGEGPAPRSGG